MRSPAILLFFAFFLLSRREAPGQDLSLPPGAETTWVVEGAEEIIAHFVFDPEAVAERLPEGMAFLTLSDLSSAGHEAARAHVAANPARAGWGISFLEIVRSQVFEIDGRSPALADNGAFAVWFGGVKPTDGSDSPPGRLALELWVPDPECAEYMREKGHYASHGDVRLTVSVSPMGVRTEFLVGSVSTGASQLFLARATLPPGHETPMHLHEVDEEVVYVLEGGLTAVLDDEEHVVGQGGTVFVPPGTWMALANRTDRPVVILGTLGRGELEQFYRVLFSKDADEAARREAAELCRIRNR